MNLQQELDKIIKTSGRKTLLLHSCCAPCSSYVLEYLHSYFEITVLFYNPNILPEKEYYKRLNELQSFIKQYPNLSNLRLIAPEYDEKSFLEATKGLEKEPEGGKRCEICFEMRLREAAIVAKNIDADYFTTALSISPHKSSALLDEIATKLEKEIGVKHLPSDFKKKGGYLRSIELSKEYGLYRQAWCGCPFSKTEQEEKAK